MTNLYSLLSSRAPRPDCVKCSICFFYHTYTLYGNSTVVSKKLSVTLGVSVTRSARHAQFPPPLLFPFPCSFFFLNYCNNLAPPQPKNSPISSLKTRKELKKEFFLTQKGVDEASTGQNIKATCNWKRVFFKMKRTKKQRT